MAVIYLPAYVNPDNLLDLLDKSLQLCLLAIGAHWLLTAVFSLSGESSVYFSLQRKSHQHEKGSARMAVGGGEGGGRMGEAEGWRVNWLQPDC